MDIHSLVREVKMIIYTASPLGAPTAEEIARNVSTAIKFGEWINTFIPGHKSIVPHRLATIMDDNNPDHRRMGLEIDLQILFPLADEVWVLGERISTGMRMEIEAAKAKDIPVRYFIEADCGYMELPIRRKLM